MTCAAACGLTLYNTASARSPVCVPQARYIWGLLSISLRGTLDLDHLSRNFAFSELAPFADRSDTEMAPEKDEKNAAGPAKTPRTFTRSADMEAKVTRIKELKAKFAGVGKALRPALIEMAGRTSQRLGRPTHDKDGRRNGQHNALSIACYERQQELKAVSVQHETLQAMTVIENRYRVSESS